LARSVANVFRRDSASVRGGFQQASLVPHPVTDELCVVEARLVNRRGVRTIESSGRTPRATYARYCASSQV